MMVNELDTTAEDPELSQICQDSFTNRNISTKPYVVISSELCVVDGVLLRGSRIVIPNKLRNDVFANAHEGHPESIR